MFICFCRFVAILLGASCRVRNFLCCIVIGNWHVWLRFFGGLRCFELVAFNALFLTGCVHLNKLRCFLAGALFLKKKLVALFANLLYSFELV